MVGKWDKLARTVGVKVTSRQPLSSLTSHVISLWFLAPTVTALHLNNPIALEVSHGIFIIIQTHFLPCMPS